MHEGSSSKKRNQFCIMFVNNTEGTRLFKLEGLNLKLANIGKRVITISKKKTKKQLVELHEKNKIRKNKFFHNFIYILYSAIFPEI